MEKNVVIKTENSSLYLSEHGYSMPIFDIDRSNVVKSSQTQDGASETIASATNNIKIEPIDELEDQPELVQLSVVKQENYDDMDDVKISIIEDEIKHEELSTTETDEMAISDIIFKTENNMSTEGELQKIVPRNSNGPIDQIQTYTIPSVDKLERKTKMYYHCRPCNYKTTCKKTLEKHIDIHRTAVKCDMCHIYSSFFQDVLEKHRKSHIQPNGTYKCQFCSKVFHSPIALSQHATMLHQNKSINMINKICPKKKLVKKNYVCTMCGFKCLQEKHFILHIIMSHNMVEVPGETESSSTSTSSMYKCLCCDKRLYGNAMNLMEHAKTHDKYVYPD